jgi:hypothetical protein
MRNSFMLLVGVCVLGGSIGYVLMAPAVEARVSIEPRRLVGAKRPIEGSQCSYNLMIVNNSSREITINEIELSCGCMRATTEPSRAPPFAVPAGSSMPMEVLINTDGRTGKQVFLVGINASESGRPLSVAPAEIEMFVLGCLSPVPNTIVWHDGASSDGKTVSANVDLVDMLPGEGSTDLEIVASNPSIVHVSSQKRRGELEKVGGIDWHVRYRVNMTMDVSSKRGNVYERVSIRTKKPVERTIVIPVVYHQTSRIALFPDILAISFDNSESRVQKSVVCVVSEENLGPPLVAEDPPRLRIRTERIGPKTYQIGLDFHRDKKGTNLPAEVYVQTKDSKDSVTLPITYSVKPVVSR